MSGRAGAVSCNHPEQLIDELNLSPTIQTAHPPRLPLPDHVHGLVVLDRSPRRVECTKALLRRHASFDRSMILLHDVVHVLDRSVAATASQDSCLFHPRNCRAVETGLVSVDVAGRSGRPGSLLTLAPHRSGRAGSAASGSSTDGFATRRRVPAGPGSQAMATAIPKAYLASSAIRCRDVETGPNLGVLAVFPSTGATCRGPLPSTGSRGLNSPASAVL